MRTRACLIANVREGVTLFVPCLTNQEYLVINIFFSQLSIKISKTESRNMVANY